MDWRQNRPHAHKNALIQHNPSPSEIKIYIPIPFSKFGFNSLKLSIKLFRAEWKTSPSEIDNVQHPPALPHLSAPSLQCCSAQHWAASTAALQEHVHSRTGNSQHLPCSFHCRAGEKPHHLKTIRTIIFEFHLASTFYLIFYYLHFYFLLGRKWIYNTVVF